MSLYIFLLLFVNVVMSLRCKTSSPSNCEYNSTCIYSTKECDSSKVKTNIRGGIYCTTLIQKSLDENILIGNMDCMYDQETSKTCKNQSQCIMKYTNKGKKFLHCCCDQDFCNLNFTSSNLSEIEPIQNITTDPSKNVLDCQFVFCKLIYLLLILSLIILSGIIICFFNRKRIFKSGNKICRLLGISSHKKKSKNQLEHNVEDIIESKPLLEINLNRLIIQNQIFKRGRFSKIYRAKFENEDVIVKLLEGEGEPRVLFNNEKEIYSSPSMSHENILKFYGYSIVNDCYYFIFEYGEKGSLRDYLYLNFIKDENELIHFCKQISSGLEYLHTDFRIEKDPSSHRPPIAHRDFKSDNIIIKQNRLIICDFALSILLDENQITPNEQQQVGTPRYMAPEILVGAIGTEASALLKSDVYALGLVFWEILSRCSLIEPDEKFSVAFEKELNLKGLNIHCTVADMSQIIHLFKRPKMNSSWRKLNNKIINDIIITIEQCWDESPDARIPAALVAHRMRHL